MQWKNGFIIGAILLSVFVMCHSEDDDDDDDNDHHHDKQYRSAGISDVSNILPPSISGRLSIDDEAIVTRSDNSGETRNCFPWPP